MTRSTPSSATQVSMPLSSPSPSARMPMTRRVSMTSSTSGHSWDNTVNILAGCFLGDENLSDDTLACTEGLNDKPVGNGSLKHLRRSLQRLSSSRSGIKPSAGKASQFDFIELFSPPRIGPRVARQGKVPAGGSVDLMTGWDFRLSEHRRLAGCLIDLSRPWFAFISPLYGVQYSHGL
eukprot:3732566-Pyramimonas_sp.AAC.1